MRPCPNLLWSWASNSDVRVRIPLGAFFLQYHNIYILLVVHTNLGELNLQSPSNQVRIMIDLLDMHEAITLLIKAEQELEEHVLRKLFGTRFVNNLIANGIISATDYLSEKERNKFVEYILDKYQKEKIGTKELL